MEEPGCPLRVVNAEGRANISDITGLCFISRLCCGHENKRIVANMSSAPHPTAMP